MVINLQTFISKADSNRTCLAVISLDSAMKKMKTSLFKRV